MEETIVFAILNGLYISVFRKTDSTSRDYIEKFNL